MSVTPLGATSNSEETVNMADSGEENALGTELIDLISTASPFQGLPPAVLAAVADTAEKRTYCAGEPVFTLGQYDAQDFYLILSGSLKVAFIDHQSGAMRIDDVEKGAVFGMETSICDKCADALNQITLTAETDVALIVFYAQPFREIVSQRPSLSRNLMQYFAETLSKTRFETMDRSSAPEQRVYAALMSFVKRDAVAGVWRVSQMPKHRELAGKANVEESIAASAVAQIIQDGVARREYPGLIINDIDRLNHLAE